MKRLIRDDYIVALVHERGYLADENRFSFIGCFALAPQVDLQRIGIRTGRIENFVQFNVEFEWRRDIGPIFRAQRYFEISFQRCGSALAELY